MRPERSWSQSDSWSQAANMLWGPGFNGVIHSQRTAYRTIGIVAVQCSLTIGTLLTTDDAQLLLRTVRNLFLLGFSIISAYHVSYICYDNDDSWYFDEVEGTLIPKAITCVSPLGQCLVWFLSREEAMPVSRWQMMTASNESNEAFLRILLRHMWCQASAFPQHPFQETGVPPRSGGQKSLFAFDVLCSFREQTLIHFLVKVQELGVNQLPGVGMFDSKVQRCQNVQRSKESSPTSSNMTIGSNCFERHEKELQQR